MSTERQPRRRETKKEKRLKAKIEEATRDREKREGHERGWLAKLGIKTVPIKKEEGKEPPL